MEVLAEATYMTVRVARLRFFSKLATSLAKDSSSAA